MSSCSNISNISSTDSTGLLQTPFILRENTWALFIKVGAKHRGQRKYGTSKRPSIMQPATKPAAPPKRELQKSTPKTAKEFIDTRWPKVINFIVYFFQTGVCTFAEYVWQHVWILANAVRWGWLQNNPKKLLSVPGPQTEGKRAKDIMGI